MDSLIRQQLAPHGVLRAGLNLANTLLVGAPDTHGEPTGIGPDVARMIAARLDVPLVCVPYASPRELADAADSNAWDICLIGAVPDRARTIAFTPAYLEIDATCLVRSDSWLRDAMTLDRIGVRIAAAAGSAYELWLTREIRHAQVIRMPTHEAACEAFAQGDADALAGLRPFLLRDESVLAEIRPVRLLDGCFTSVQQAVGTHRRHDAGAGFLREIVEEATTLGMIDALIERHQVRGVRSALPRKTDADC